MINWQHLNGPEYNNMENWRLFKKKCDSHSLFKQENGHHVQQRCHNESKLKNSQFKLPSWKKTFINFQQDGVNKKNQC